VHFHVADRREIEQTSRRVTDTSALRRRRETVFLHTVGGFTSATLSNSDGEAAQCGALTS
jgi:hypothetical protein